MTADAATIAYYQANAPRYTLSFGQGPSRHLDAFLDGLEVVASRQCIPATRKMGFEDDVRIDENRFVTKPHGRCFRPRPP